MIWKRKKFFALMRFPRIKTGSQAKYSERNHEIHDDDEEISENLEAIDGGKFGRFPWLVGLGFKTRLEVKTVMTGCTFMIFLIEINPKDWRQS